MEIIAVEVPVLPSVEEEEYIIQLLVSRYEFKILGRLFGSYFDKEVDKLCNEWETVEQLPDPFFGEYLLVKDVGRYTINNEVHDLELENKLLLQQRYKCSGRITTAGKL